MIGLAHSVDHNAHSTRPHIVVEQIQSETTGKVLLRPGGDESGPDPVLDGVATPESAGDPVFSFPEWKDGWDKADEKRFQKLAMREATGEIEAGDQIELNRLQVRRRGFRSPRAIEDVLFDHRRNQLLRDLEKSLSAYVEFVNP